MEGSAVMACELFGAKLVAPYFGTSLYVWAGALALTLGGLMSGYFIGGVISKKGGKNERNLFLILVISGAFLFLMPYTSDWVMKAMIDLPLQWGVIFSLLIFMFPPLLFMGMVSPMMINLLTREAADAGSSAGNVYAISTLGGIIMTFLLGFWIIPNYGITWPAIVIGLMLALFPAASLLRRQSLLGAGAIAALLLLAAVRSPYAASSTNFKVLLHSEGILGQLKVISFGLPGPEERLVRGLVVNNTLQTIVDMKDFDFNYWPYTAYIPHFASAYPPDSKALLLGMGGGTLVRRLDSLQFDLDVVEIDQRIRDLATTHFGLSSGYRIHIDDARHFVRTTSKKYALIVYDVFKGEAAPEHVLTLESMQETEEILGEGGLILINFYGYLEGDLGLVTRSVAKTAGAAGFEVRIHATPGAPDNRNVILAAWPDGQPSPLDAPVAQPRFVLDDAPREMGDLDLSEGVVLTDKQPRMDIFARAAMQWRRLYNDFLVKE